jgi:TonB family protein
VVRRLLLTALAALVPFTAQASVSPPPGNAQQPLQIVSFATPPVGVSCEQGSARLVEGAALPSRTWQPWVPPVSQPGYTPPVQPTSQVYVFSVDAEGRVTDLKAQGSAGVPIYGPSDEQSATLASWRFAAGAPATGCKIDLALTYTALNATAPAKLFEILASEQRNAPPSLRKALAAGTGCEGGVQRRPNVIVYPDLRAFDDKTIDPAWAAVRYDIDAGGAVRNVRIAAQHGEPAFADAVASATGEAKFFPGAPRAGCFLTYKAQPKATSASKHPDEAGFGRPGDACKVAEAALNLPDNKFFPAAYAKRRVGGWAILRFDVAPWGQVGAIEVLASQPSAAFGDAARVMIMSARPTPPSSGYRGCIVPVVYAIPAIPDDGN